MLRFPKDFVSVPSISRRVLVVEDDPIALKVMTRLLTIADYDVLSAHDLAHAGNQLVWQPDFVLLDLMLPDGNGASLLPRIRKQDPAPLVAILSAGSDELLADAIRLGPDAVFRKPIDLPALLEWLKNPRPFVFKPPGPPLNHTDHDYTI